MISTALLNLDRILTIPDPKLRLEAYEIWKVAWLVEAWVIQSIDPDLLKGLTPDKILDVEVRDTEAVLEALGQSIVRNGLLLGREDLPAGEPVPGQADQEASRAWPRTKFSVFCVLHRPLPVRRPIIVPPKGLVS